MTIVTLYFPHTLMDAMGQKSLLNAWCLMLRGEEEKIVTPFSTEADPLATLGTAPNEAYKLASRALGMLGLVGYGLTQALNFIRASENRMVCVPACFVEKLRSEVVSELTTFDPNSTFCEPHLTDSDILCALWTRILLSHSTCYPEQTVTLNNAFDIRKALRSDFIPEGENYLSNAV